MDYSFLGPEFKKRVQEFDGSIVKFSEVMIQKKFINSHDKETFIEVMRGIPEPDKSHFILLVGDDYNKCEICRRHWFNFKQKDASIHTVLRQNDNFFRKKQEQDEKKYEKEDRYKRSQKELGNYRAFEKRYGA